MAVAELEYPFAEIRGSIGKDGIVNRKKKYRAVKNYARYEICSQYSISEKTFYSIRDVLSYLCDDVN